MPSFHDADNACPDNGSAPPQCGPPFSAYQMPRSKDLHIHEAKHLLYSHDKHFANWTSELPASLLRVFFVLGSFLFPGVPFLLGRHFRLILDTLPSS